MRRSAISALSSACLMVLAAGVAEAFLKKEKTMSDEDSR